MKLEDKIKMDLREGDGTCWR